MRIWPLGLVRRSFRQAGQIAHPRFVGSFNVPPWLAGSSDGTTDPDRRNPTFYNDLVTMPLVGYTRGDRPVKPPGTSGLWTSLSPDVPGGNP